jgi:hypothetical protein
VGPELARCVHSKLRAPHQGTSLGPLVRGASYLPFAKKNSSYSSGVIPIFGAVYSTIKRLIIPELDLGIARTLLPTALASEPLSFVFFRVRVRVLGWHGECHGDTKRQAGYNYISLWIKAARGICNSLQWPGATHRYTVSYLALSFFLQEHGTAKRKQYGAFRLRSSCFVTAAGLFFTPPTRMP